MKDLFARIGTVLESLLVTSTVHGAARDEANRLVEELKGLDLSIEEVVADRVRAATEGLGGQVQALEEGQGRTSGILFSTAARNALLATTDSEEEHKKLEALFNGANPAAFDHDKDGNAGGSEAHPPTDNPDDMTVAQAKAWLDERQIEYPSGARRDELRELVKSKMPAPVTDGGTGGPETAAGEEGAQTLTGGDGNDSVEAGGA